MTVGAVTVSGASIYGFKGAIFDGVDDYVSLGTQITKELNYNDNWSVSCWVLNKTSATGHIFNSVINSSNRVAIMFDAGEVKFGVYDGGSYTAKSGVGLANKWYNILATNTNKTVNLYINGVLQVGVSAPASASTAITNIGAKTDNSGTLLGYVSDVKIYNRVLGQAEATKLAANQDISEGLVHRYKLRDNYNDSVGTAHGTNSGSRLLIEEENTRSFLSGARLSANDKYLIWDGGDKINSLVLNEA